MNAPGKKIIFFATLYYVQGAAFAYAVNFQKPYLAGEGVNKQSLGLFTSLLLLPFIFKIFLGVLSDRVPIGRFGSRKPYMILGLALFAFCYFMLTGVAKPVEQFTVFAALTWIASLGLALFDTCCDGYAMDVASEAEQSSVQAAMVAGRALGLISMSFAFGFLTDQFGIHSVFAVLGTLALAVAVFVVVVNFKVLSPGRRAGGARWRDLLTPAYFIFAAFGIGYSIASFGADGIVTLYLREVHQVSNGAIGQFGAMRGLGALLGATLFAVVSRHWPLHRALLFSVAALSLGCLVLMTPASYIWIGLVWGLCWGVQETAYVTLAMRFSTGPWAATFFALAMIFSNIGTAIGEALAAPIAEAAGYGYVFGGFALLAAGLVPAVHFARLGK